jgi:hypothetical protein
VGSSVVVAGVLNHTSVPAGNCSPVQVISSPLELDAVQDSKSHLVSNDPLLLKFDD